MARAIPAFFFTVPINDTSRMGTYRAQRMNTSIFIAVGGNFFTIHLQNFTHTRRQPFQRIGFVGLDTVGNKMIGNIRVLFNELAEAIYGFDPRRAEQAGVWAGPLPDKVTQYFSGNTAEHHPVAV